MKLFAILLVIVLSAGAAAEDVSDLLRVVDGKRVDFDLMIEEASGKPLILVGETHDSAFDHSEQLRILDALRVKGAPLAIGLEMFGSRSQRALDLWVEGKLPLERFIPVYRKNWAASWDLYRDIFLFARRYRIPMIGLNASPEIVRKAARNGIDSLSQREKRELPPGITCTTDKNYRRYIEQVFSLHMKNGYRDFTRFCEAQMIWNRTMAWRLTDYLRDHPRTRVVALTGVGHALRPAIPDQVAQLSPMQVMIVAPLSMQTRELPQESGADYLYGPPEHASP